MMATYLICNTEKFSKEPFNSESQLTLKDESGFNYFEGEPTTRMEIDKKGYFQDFYSFKCHHELKEKVAGKVFGKSFNHYLKPYEFHTFYDEDSKVTLIRLNTDAAIDFMETLNNKKVYKLKRKEVNFPYIISKVHEVSGLWVSEINNVNLSSAGYYGKDVHRDEDVRDMIGNGEISYLQIKYTPFNGNEELTIGISKKGSVTLYNRLDNINDELEIVIDIYKKLLEIPVLS
jgi:hypothetical protein